MIDWSSKNLSKAMVRLIRQVRLHFENPMRDVDDDATLWYLLLWTGIEDQEISDAFFFRHNEERSVEAYIKYFSQYVSPPSNFCVVRHEQLQCVQNQDESAHSFLKRLRQIAIQCEYEQVVKDMLVSITLYSVYIWS